jgi:hypothetical protein
MRLLDQDPIDPEIAATLDAIDATLAGEPVDARYAELAEIALLLSSDRPPVRPEFARTMDERVARRFASAPPTPGSQRPRRPLLRNPAFWQASGALMTGVAVVVALVVVMAGHLGSSAASSSASFGAVNGAPGVVSSASSSAPGTATSAGSAWSAAAAAPSPSASSGAASTASSARAPAARSAQSSSAGSLAAPPAPAQPNSAAGAPALQPPTAGRKVVQSAQLSLTAAPNRIDDVAQQVYDVVGSLNGIVESSTVTQTGGTDGYANFSLSVPSGSLGQAMSRLSSLNYAQVASRTDASQDITDQYNGATRALADARALRTSLLKQLANATTTDQIDSIQAQINDAEASISSDVATLNRLNHQVNFSQLSVTINAQAVPVPVAHGSGGFGIGRAAHDAGRVLTVVAGGALIAVAELTPVGLLLALAWWVAAAVRRRRREQALDSV